MNFLIPASIFVLGVIIGSFLNVLGLRWNSGVSIGGRSFCVVCRKMLRWWELVPMISFVSLRGRCSECKTNISWQYPLIELWTGLVFLSLFLVLDPFVSLGSTIHYALTISVFCIYIVITIYDARHKIIPDTLVYASLILALGARVLSQGTLIDWLAGPLVFVFFALLWIFTRGKAMGFGDAKLGLSIGLLLGASVGFSGIVLAFWIGTVFALLTMLLGSLSVSLAGKQKRLTMKSEIPFAPFMILGAWISLVFNLDLLHVLTFFQ